MKLNNYIFDYDKYILKIILMNIVIEFSIALTQLKTKKI